MIKTLSILFLLSLSACGFSPVYGTYSAKNNVNVQTQLNQIEIATIADKSGIDLRNSLLDKLYAGIPAATPQYKLETKQQPEIIVDSGIARDATTTREQMTLKVIITLTEIETGETLINREFKAITNYNILASEYATLIARQDARKRGLSQIAEDIVTQFSLYFAGQP